MKIKKAYISIFFFGLICSLKATSLVYKPFEEVVKESDHILIGTIKKVDMIDKENQEVADLNARTGLGVGTRNEERNGIMVSVKLEFSYLVPLEQMIRI